MKQPNLGNDFQQSPSIMTAATQPDFARRNLDQNQATNDRPMYTGRYLVTFDDPAERATHLRLMEQKAGFKVAQTSDFSSQEDGTRKTDGADVLFYDQLGVALISGDDEQQIQMLTENASPRMTIEPELVVYVPDDIPVGINSASSWGIRATKTDLSAHTGIGIKVAVLDTGFDLQHPDFKNRNITSKSFVPNEQVQDGHGHGTHCIGISCGDTDNTGLRYGVAGGADIYAGKVLSNMGRGAQQYILDGIVWAADQGCHIISMSLGSPVFAGQGANPAYEAAARYALSKGCIILAAAGNESQRSRQRFQPVGSPANCPSILAVAALDINLDVADFSNRGINSGINGGVIDIAAPGVDIYSSWPMGIRYKTISGTSMATPFAAGIAALLWSANPGATNNQIIRILNSNAQKLMLPAMDVGVGLAIA